MESCGIVLRFRKKSGGKPLRSKKDGAAISRPVLSFFFFH
jgi:hypothetical protein